MSDSAQTVAVIRKNSREEIHVTLDTFKGTNLVDLRVFADFKDTGDPLATKKGLSLNVARFPELIEALTQARDTAREMGWIGDE